MFKKFNFVDISKLHEKVDLYDFYNFFCLVFCGCHPSVFLTSLGVSIDGVEYECATNFHELGLLFQYFATHPEERL